MATTYYSQAAFPGIRQDATTITNRFRSIREGRDTLAATIKIPAGTNLAVNDVFAFFTLGAGVEPLSMSLRTDRLDDSTGVVLDVGNPTTTDAYIDGFTGGQTAGGARVRVENGGDDPLADPAFVVFAAPTLIQGIVQVVPTTQTTVGALDRYVTLEMDFQYKNFRVPEVSLAYNYGN